MFRTNIFFTLAILLAWTCHSRATSGEEDITAFVDATIFLMYLPSLMSPAKMGDLLRATEVLLKSNLYRYSNPIKDVIVTGSSQNLDGREIAEGNSTFYAVQANIQVLIKYGEELDDDPSDGPFVAGKIVHDVFLDDWDELAAMMKQLDSDYFAYLYNIELQSENLEDLPFEISFEQDGPPNEENAMDSLPKNLILIFVILGIGVILALLTLLLALHIAKKRRTDGGSRLDTTATTYSSSSVTKDAKSQVHDEYSCEPRKARFQLFPLTTKTSRDQNHKAKLKPEKADLLNQRNDHSLQEISMTPAGRSDASPQNSFSHSFESQISEGPKNIRKTVDMQLQDSLEESGSCEKGKKCAQITIEYDSSNHRNETNPQNLDKQIPSNPRQNTPITNQTSARTIIADNSKSNERSNESKVGKDLAKEPSGDDETKARRKSADEKDSSLSLYSDDDTRTRPTVSTNNCPFATASSSSETYPTTEPSKTGISDLNHADENGYLEASRAQRPSTEDKEYNLPSAPNPLRPFVAHTNDHDGCSVSTISGAGSMFTMETMERKIFHFDQNILQEVASFEDDSDEEDEATLMTYHSVSDADDFGSIAGSLPGT